MASDRPATPRPRAGVLRAAVVGVVLVAAFGTWVAMQRAASAAASAERDLGTALFHGNAPLQAHLPGHTEPLPTAATRCSNCHEARSSGTVQGAYAASAADTSYALALGRDGLTQPRSRRGGPPSVYDASSLCTLLRTGVDPAHVLIATVMPRYDAPDAQCRALWAHLLQRP